MPETFGKYELIEKLGDGGMAEVYLAKQIGDLAGFEKQVAVKCIYPHLTDREDLVVMFLDEARIAAQLNHPNIVQVFDLGKVDDTLYIAMEYVHGRDLRHICEVGLERGDFLRREFAARIVSEAAAGLHYAHTSTDEKGQPRNIVHRDVSPQNIMVSMEGQVKVADFGVAKAEDRIGKTQAGQRKGKLSYMSPEQFDSGTVDARSDVYTLGIVLYETTVCRRLFRGNSDFETMSMIANATVTPPSEVRADYPVRLEAIVMKALQKDPNERFESARAFQLALEDWLHDQNVRVGRMELASYMQGLFPDGLDVQGVDAPAAAPERQAPPTQQASAGREAPAGRPAAGEPSRSGGPPVPKRPAAAGGPPGSKRPAAAGGPPGSKRPAAAGGPPGSKRPPGAGAPPPASGGEPTRQLSPSQGATAAQPAAADLNAEVDEVDFSDRRLQIIGAVGGVFALIGAAVVIYFIANAEPPPPSEELLEYERAIEEAADDVPEPPEFVAVAFQTEPDGAHVVVNGLRQDGVTPGRFDLVADSPNEVIFFHPQYPPRRVIVDGRQRGEPLSYEFELFDDEPDTGTLVIESDPSGGIVYLDGQRLGAAPQTVEDVTAGFDHHVEVRKSGLWNFAGIFQLLPDRRSAFRVSLVSKDKPSARRYVRATYDAVQTAASVYVDGELRGNTPLVVNQLRNNLYRVRVDKAHHEEQDRYVLLHDVGTFTMRNHLEPIERHKGRLSVSAEPSGSMIYIGANSYGTKPVKNLELFEGDHTVVVEPPGGGRHKVTVQVRPKTTTAYRIDTAGPQATVERVD